MMTTHPHPETVSHKVERARAYLAEYVDFVDGSQGSLSTLPGTPPEYYPPYLLGMLLDKASRLLLALDEADAARY